MKRLSLLLSLLVFFLLGFNGCGDLYPQYREKVSLKLNLNIRDEKRTLRSFVTENEWKTQKTHLILAVPADLSPVSKDYLDVLL